VRCLGCRSTADIQLSGTWLWLRVFCNYLAVAVGLLHYLVDKALLNAVVKPLSHACMWAKLSKDMGKRMGVSSKSCRALSDVHIVSLPTTALNTALNTAFLFFTDLGVLHEQAVTTCVNP
jgi:hypothetical protein